MKTDQPTDDELRETIAEACGWKHEIRRSYRETAAWFHPNGVTMRDAPPDYLRSLDAIHDAEQTLDTNHEAIYYDRLCEISGVNAYRATARQRALAFVQTLAPSSVPTRPKVFSRNE